MNQQLETLSGIRMKPSFNPQLIAGFDEIWDETFHQKWQLIYEKDLRLQQNYDFFQTVVNRVKMYNESYDMTIVGDRGLGKSAFGLGAVQIIHR
ncbi:hypothetical protein [Methanosarcina siciliae]|uniref:hypothetical protein n=1 Tax=Methanosarcina siciliae TaxID=38027 RepID=UPI00064E2097|nr:hypothetical protein [Methanosarcina siciliae]